MPRTRGSITNMKFSIESGCPFHLRRFILCVGLLSMTVVLPSSSFVFEHLRKTQVGTTTSLQQPPLILSASSNNDDSSSPTGDDSYLNFEQTLKNAAAKAADVVTTIGTVDVKNVEKTFKSAAEMATSGFSSVAKRGGEDVMSLADRAFSDARKMAEFSTDGLRNTSFLAAEFATKGTGDLIRLTEQGIYDLQTLTKNGTDQVGAVATWIDTQAKSGSELVSSKAKSLVLNFTGKEQYNFGDISNELVRRIATKEIAIQDTILVIKLLVALGASIGPLAKMLPLTVLLEALNVSLEQKIGGKVLEALALTIDSRIVAAFSSDEKLQLGDAVKRTVLSGVLAFTGKSKYESGDIQRVIEQSEENELNPSQLDLKVNSELQEWDRQFVQRCIESAQTPTSSDAKALDIKISLALEECAKLEELNRAKKSIGATNNYFNSLER